MKLLKKISYFVVAFMILLVQTSATGETETVEASGKTLRKMKEELAGLEAKLETSKREQQSAQNGINNSKHRIEEISQEKVDIENEIDDLSGEITDLNKDIVEMNSEIKDILGYYQLSNTGDSGALEYVFDSDDYTDFVYRMAITEQLSDYYDDKIKEYNKKISDNESKKVQLADKKVSLGQKEEELEVYIQEQQTRLDASMDGALDIEQEIAALRKNIKLYEETYKCKLDETIDECLRDKLPSGSLFYRPLANGRVTSNYGHRTYMLGGRWVSDFHYGVDIASYHGAPVYSAANGKVSAIIYRYNCGGNMVYINHVINGKKYTTGYYHMGTVNVSVGQNVTYQTVIGTQGGNPRIEYWDRCSTGSHLHFTVSTGNWGNDYSTYSGFISRNFNPRKVLKLPALGSSFSGRTR